MVQVVSKPVELGRQIIYENKRGFFVIIFRLQKKVHSNVANEEK